jgi:transcription termination/antitermination protein NusG
MPSKKAKWYIVATARRREQSIKEQIEKRREALGIEKRIPEVVIPTQKKVEIKQGKKVVKEKRLLPGYIVVKMIMDTDTFTLVRNIEGVKGFVSTGKRPKPLSEEEVDNIMKFKEEREVETYEKTFKVGDAVKVKSGAFIDSIGTVKQVYPEKGKIKVDITIFGRETPVELGYSNVEKL